MTEAFIFCAGLIPAVPLYGAELFHKRKDKPRRNACIILFVLQLLLSIGYVVAWLKTH